MNEVADLDLPMQENVHADLRSLFRGAVQLTVETVLQEVVRDVVGAARWQWIASRKDVRNGTYLRTLLTTMGLIEVAVPRTRDSGSAVDVLGRYRRRSGELDDAIVTAYVTGSSTRDVEKITEALVGERVNHPRCPLGPVDPLAAVDLHLLEPVRQVACELKRRGPVQFESKDWRRCASLQARSDARGSAQHASSARVTVDVPDRDPALPSVAGHVLVATPHPWAASTI